MFRILASIAFAVAVALNLVAYNGQINQDKTFILPTLLNGSVEMSVQTGIAVLNAATLVLTICLAVDLSRQRGTSKLIKADKAKIVELEDKVKNLDGQIIGYQVAIKELSSREPQVVIKEVVKREVIILDSKRVLELHAESLGHKVTSKA